MQNKKNKNSNPFQSYKKTDVLTANRETILIMMYDGAIRFLKKAIDSSKANKVEEKNIFVGRTMDIVNELRATLNHKAGGEIAEKLDGLYDFICDRLLKGSMENNPKQLEEALGILTTLRTAWDEAIEALKTDSAQPQEP